MNEQCILPLIVASVVFLIGVFITRYSYESLLNVYRKALKINNYTIQTYKQMVDDYRDALGGQIDQAARAKALQARIDELMFEHCPDEMTDEQVRNWEKHQRVVDDLTFYN